MAQRDDDKLVRQLSLIAFLMSQHRPVTAEEIHEAVEGYGGMSEQAFLRRFYSDRSELETVGFRLAVERPGDDPFQGDLYALPPENYYLPPIEFDQAELSALHTCLFVLEGQFAYAEPLRLALQHLTLGRPSPLDDHAARTVAVDLVGSAQQSDVAAHLIKIESAISRRKTIRFPYYTIGRDQREEREVDPYSLLYMAGNWYVVAYSHEREAMRCFRLSRIEGRITFRTRAEHDFPPPSDLDLSRYRDRAPWQLEDAVGTARIALSPTIAWWVEQMFGSHGRIETGADGRAVFETDFGSPREMLGWALGLGVEAEVLGPPELRDAAVAALVAVRDMHIAPQATLPRIAAARADAPASAPATAGGSERVIPVERISRLLALMTRLLAACGDALEARVPCGELRGELNLTQEALEEDLTLLNLINFGGGCYTLYAQVTDGAVSVTKELYGAQFARPARLSPLEGKALLWALDFVGDRLPIGDERALASARTKIEAAVGDGGAGGVELGRTNTASAAVNAAISRAMREDRLLEIEYWTESRGALSARTVEPHMLQNARDAWYLVAYCRRADGQRTFRMDRIRSARVLDERFERRPDVGVAPYVPRAQAGGPGSHGQSASVWCSAEIARWLVEEHPSAARYDDGSVLVEIPYAGDEWIVKEIVKHRGKAQLVEPAGLRATVAERASRMLALYEGGTAAGAGTAARGTPAG